MPYVSSEEQKVNTLTPQLVKIIILIITSFLFISRENIKGVQQKEMQRKSNA